jgi:hypothetical protein
MFHPAHARASLHANAHLIPPLPLHIPEPTQITT